MAEVLSENVSVQP
jgi:hypothetical protein